MPETKTDSELYKAYRPRDFSEVIGQDQAVRTLEELVRRKKVPHAILLTGPSGCGKTTLARILRKHVDCTEENYREINASDFRGIDTVRDIRSTMGLAPLGGKSRVFCIDEAQKLTNDAQNAFLKMLEDTPKHVYFIFCTTDPAKILRTIITRCTKVQVQGIPDKAMRKLLDEVCESEGFDISDEVLDRIVEYSEGSARLALVNLEKVAGLKDEDERLEALQRGNFNVQGIELCRALIKGASWGEVTKILKAIDEEPETVRRMVLGYMTTILLSKPKPDARAFLIIEAFRDHFYDSGKAGLAASCYEVVVGA